MDAIRNLDRPTRPFLHQ
uniref:Uncharacterized protein n=1 Tax=Arundo donax TaxID=35708 RepID=A0A0A8Z9L7_ARUDO